MKKLAVIITHPIQYYAPVFRLLAQRQRVRIKVFYTWPQASQARYDPGFKRAIQWDIPLLEGYEYAFIKNDSFLAGSNSFLGAVNNLLLTQVALWQPQALLVVGWSIYSHLKAMVHFKGKIPVLFRGDSTLLDEKPGLIRYLRGLYLPLVYRYVDKALYVGKNNREYFLKYGLKDEQLLFAPHAIDISRFQEEDKNRARGAELRKSMGIAEDKIVFLFAGKLEPKKDPFLLLEAFRRLNDERTHLVFVGSGILEGRLKRRAPARVHFMGFQNQGMMPAVYCSGDIFVLPSFENETWGLAVNEAMACGLPILVSDKCGCAADLAVDGKNGYIFSARDKNMLCVKMKEIAQRDRIRIMGEVSRELIRAWSIEALCRAIEESILRGE